MPTGVALHDPRSRLIAAGERVLLREGPAGLTSRTVTDEAGVAKGVLHRHFADFEAFLAALVAERIAIVEAVSAELAGQAGAGTVVGNISTAMIRIFDRLGLAVIRLVMSRDGLAARLRTGTPRGIPTLAEAADGLTGYLSAEQRIGRILPEASPAALAMALVGTGHLLFAGELGGLPDRSAVEGVVESITVDAARP